MKKRRAARELALIAFSSLVKGLKKTSNIDISEIIEKSTETLTSEAEKYLDSATRELLKIRNFVQDYEIEHPVNLERPFDAGTIPVNIPLTSDMLGRIDSALDAINKTYSALELTDLVSHEKLDEVKEYAIKIVKTFLKNKKTIDLQIKEKSEGWDAERIVKVDRDILRMAIAEILYFEDVPKQVAIDEAVEIAKKYSSEESAGFINGILGHIDNV